MNQDTIAVIRGVGERTLPMCRALLEIQLPSERIHLASAVPFETTLEHCYEIGIASGAKWMLTVDADVLMFPGSVSTLIDAATEMPACYAQLEGRIFDKILGTYRQAGHRIYRTSILKTARQLIPDAGTAIRPEHETLQRLGKRGHPSRRISEVIGLHDFEQYYKDLYRKSFVHAIKHYPKAREILQRCAKNREADTDFNIIRRAVHDGLESTEQISIDKSKFDSRSDVALRDLGLDEKQPLIINAPINFIENLEKSITEIPTKLPTTDIHRCNVSELPFVKRVAQRFSEQGVAASILGALANRCEQASAKLSKR